MYCENHFCIYWSENHCIVDEITIDALGRCDACILVNIDEETLNDARKKLLDCYAEQEALWDQ